MVQICNVIISPGVLFNFRILIFQIVRVLKGQKKWPKMTKLCLLHLISRNHISYDLHLWYTYMYKRVISPSIFFFFFFKILILGIIKRAKNDPKWQKVLPVSLRISGTVHHMIVIFGTHVWNYDISSKFFHFSKFWFLGFLGGVKGQKMT